MFSFFIEYLDVWPKTWPEMTKISILLCYLFEISSCVTLELSVDSNCVQTSVHHHPVHLLI